MKKVIFIIVITLISSGCVRRSGKKKLIENNPKINHHVVKSKKRKATASKSIVGQSALPVNTGNKIWNGSEVFERYNSAVFMVFTSDGYNVFQGSGFFISERGIAVSNFHVFKNTGIEYARIRLPNNKVFEITDIIAQSPKNDYIIFRVASNGMAFNYIPISNKIPKIGEKVYTIGSPLGLENTFSSGEVSGIREPNLIQITAPIDHGSSGGALLNVYGEAIGITTSGIDTSGANLNFAIDINVIKRALSQ